MPQENSNKSLLTAIVIGVAAGLVIVSIYYLFFFEKYREEIPEGRSLGAAIEGMEQEVGNWFELGFSEFGFSFSYPERINHKTTELLISEDESEGDWRRTWILFDSTLEPDSELQQNFRNQIVIEAVKINHPEASFSAEIEGEIFTYSGSREEVWLSEDNSLVSWREMFGNLEEGRTVRIASGRNSFYYETESGEWTSEKGFRVFGLNPLEGMEMEDLYLSVRYRINYPDDFNFLEREGENPFLIFRARTEYQAIKEAAEEIIKSAALF